MKLGPEYFKAVVEFSDDAIVGKSADGTITAWNKGARKLYGFTAKEVIGKQITTIVPKDRLHEVKFFDTEIIQGRKIDRYETVRLRKDGGLVPISLSIAPVKDRTGKVVGSISIAWDVSESKQLEGRLKQQETVSRLGLMALAGIRRQELMDEIVKALSDTLMVDYAEILELMPDKNKLVVRSSVGWGQEVKQNKTTVDAGLGSQSGYTLLSKRPVIVTDLNRETRFTATDILKNHGIVSGMSVVVGYGGKPFGVMGVHTPYRREFTMFDVHYVQAVATLLAMAVERRRLERQKDEFIAIASHELKTPLTSLKIFGQVLHRKFKKADDFEATDLLLKMDSQLNKLTALVTDLLDVSKIEAGRLEFHHEEFNLDTLIKEIAEETQRTTEDHTIELKLGSPCTIYGDRYRTEQVLINLLSNAIKYSPYAERIIIRSKCNKKEARVCVQDFGMGIPKKIYRKIFERFYRASGTKEETYPGMGLGLYIASEIVTRQGGKIWVESKVGKGSTFCFTLPIIKP